MQQTELLPDEATMYAAFVNRDAEYEGMFVMGVRTTGVFCRPGCSARAPRRENVEFFPRAGDALAAGYRPCLRCRPLEPKGQVPDWLKPLLEAVDREPGKRWTTEEIREQGAEPARVRRWFQNNHGMTFLAYLRARRLGTAFSRIREGEDVITAGIDADFSSASGFAEALRRTTGRPPRGSTARTELHVAQCSSPLGPVVIAGDRDAVHLVEFWDRRMLETQFKVLEQRLGVVFFPGETEPMRNMQKELEAYFARQLERFRTPLALPGSALQQEVWRALMEVPYGLTWTYGELARRVGRPKAVRAVARAVGENRLAIVIPCHRIVGSDGRLTGYGGGLWRKRHLLALEGGREPGSLRI